VVLYSLRSPAKTFRELYNTEQKLISGGYIIRKLIVLIDLPSKHRHLATIHCIKSFVKEGDCMTDEKGTLVRVDDKQPNENLDPITGEPGSHFIGTGIGAAGAGTAGAAIGGAVGGPIGALIGAAVGGIAGGLAGKGVAEEINPTVENEYWRENYSSCPYVEPGVDYDQYAPAYQHGWAARVLYAGKTFDEAEADLQHNWEINKANQKLTWDKARLASRDAWNRIEEHRRKTDTP
jgi:uncharacterized protein YcfJ